MTAAFPAPRKPPTKEDANSRPRKPARMTTAPPAAPSNPVVISTRSAVSRPRRFEKELADSHGMRSLEHDPDLLPPSVAALLAITSIPIPKRPSGPWRSGGRSNPYMNGDMLGTEYGPIHHQLSVSSPQSWDLLQSPPVERDIDRWESANDEIGDLVPSIRSMSSESMPSLEVDSGSVQSASNPSTPALVANHRDRRRKSSFALDSQNCDSDHPLDPSQPPPNSVQLLAPTEAEHVSGDARKPHSLTTVSIKSNLTASLRVLRSAARSFSNIATPVVLRDDFLTRSILSISPQYTDERRPSLSIPSRELKQTSPTNELPLSPAELHIYYDHEHDRPSSTRSRCTTSIQLQTYSRTRNASAKATSPPIFIAVDSSGTALDTGTIQDVLLARSSLRQREPRENSDFLRVIVLEMNMRKAGKLSDAAPGRARIWLPPRQVVDQSRTEMDGPMRRWSTLVD